jgi:hypothetical protein
VVSNACNQQFVSESLWMCFAPEQYKETLNFRFGMDDDLVS